MITDSTRKKGRVVSTRKKGRVVSTRKKGRGVSTRKKGRRVSTRKKGGMDAYFKTLYTKNNNSYSINFKEFATYWKKLNNKHNNYISTDLGKLPIFNMANFNVFYGNSPKQFNDIEKRNQDIVTELANFIVNAIKKGVSVVTLQEVIGKKISTNPYEDNKRVNNKDHVYSPNDENEKQFFSNWYETFTKILDENEIKYHFFQPDISSFYEQEFGNMIIYDSNVWELVKSFDIPSILPVLEINEPLKQSLIVNNKLEEFYNYRDVETRSLGGLILQSVEQPSHYICPCVTHFTEKSLLNKTEPYLKSPPDSMDFGLHRQPMMGKLVANAIRYLKNTLKIPVFLGGDFNVNIYQTKYNCDKITPLCLRENTATDKTNPYNYSRKYSDNVYKHFTDTEPYFYGLYPPNFNAISSDKQRLVDNIYSSIQPNNMELLTSKSHQNSNIILSDHLPQLGQYTIQENIGMSFDIANFDNIIDKMKAAHTAGVSKFIEKEKEYYEGISVIKE